MRQISPDELAEIQADWRRNADKAEHARIDIVCQLHALRPEELLKLPGLSTGEKPVKGSHGYAPELKKRAIQAVRERGLTQSAAAKELGVSRAAVSAWVHEEQNQREQHEKMEDKVVKKESTVKTTDPVICLLESKLNSLVQAGKMFEESYRQLQQLGLYQGNEEEQKLRSIRLDAFAAGMESALRAVYEAQKGSEET